HPTAISPLSLHDALPIYLGRLRGASGQTHDARFGLHQDVVGALVAVRPVGSVARDAAPDEAWMAGGQRVVAEPEAVDRARREVRSEEHTSELQSRGHLVC